MANPGACKTSITVCRHVEEQRGRKTKLLNWENCGRYILIITSCRMLKFLSSPAE